MPGLRPNVDRRHHLVHNRTMPTDAMRSQWDISTATIAAAYALTPEEVQQMAYALAEQIHDKHCLSTGLSHGTSRPDEHVAMAMLKGLAGAGWWLTRREPGVADDATEG